MKSVQSIATRFNPTSIIEIGGGWLACPRKLCRTKLLHQVRQQRSEHAMAETLQPVAAGFNKSLRVESRAERLTSDAGAVVLREIVERSGQSSG